MAKFDWDKFEKAEESKGQGSFSWDAFEATGEESPVDLDSGGIVDTVVGGLVKAGKFIDSYTGAPTRSAIDAGLDLENPLTAFARQFGENPDNAPTGKQLATKMGVPDIQLEPEQYQGADPKSGLQRNLGAKDPITLPGAVGLTIDVAADPLNILPLGGAAKLLGRAGSGAAKGVGAAVKAVTPNKVKNASEAVLETVKKSALATKGALDNIFSPKQAEDFTELKTIAEKNGIPIDDLPASVEFGPNSVISRGERTIREGPAGQPEIDRFTKAYDAVQEATNNKLQKIGGGLPLNEAEAGTLIRGGYDEAVDRLFDDVDFTYNSVIDQSPGISLTNESLERLNKKINDLDVGAQRRFEDAITKSDKEQANQLLNAIKVVRKRLSAKDPTAGTFGSMKQVYEAMSDIGRHAFKRGQNSLTDVPVDTKKFQELYFSMREEFLNSTADQLGPEIAQSLIDSNELITQFNKNKGTLAKLVGNKDLAPERLFNSLIVNGDTQKVAALKEMLTPEQFNQLKGSLLENLVRRDPDGSISFKNLFNAMRSRRNVIEAMFEPGEIQEFAELVKLGDRLGPMVLSTSGTGGSNLFSNMLEGVKSGAANRTVIDLIKNSARGRGGQAAESVPVMSENIIPSKVRSLRERSNAEEAAKYLQVFGAQSVNEKNNEGSAAKRRLEAARQKSK